MKTTHQIAKHFRDVHFGGNWTSVNLKDTLSNINYQQATTRVYELNTIAVLVFHIGYYVNTITKVLQGEPLNAHDKFSFDLPPINNEQDWQNLLYKTFTAAETMAALIETLDEDILSKDFTDPKYGNYYRNLAGVIEHTHYHLGQIVLIKTILSH